MMKRVTLILLTMIATGLTVTIGARGYASPPEELAPRTSGAEETGPVLCFPGTEPPGPQPERPYRSYLPLILGESVEPPLTSCDVVEIEINDTHTDAQILWETCVAGDTSWSGDADWYRLNVCSGPLDLILALEGPAGADLDLYLHTDPPGWPLYSSEGIGTSNEVITATGLVTGTYYALVQPIGGQGNYTLGVAVRRR